MNTDIIRIIERKRDGHELSRNEIQYFIQGYTNGHIPDYQASALLMAICCQGATLQETFHLTETMIHTGEILDLTTIPGLKIDKHSTGGVGDKLSLTALPLAAAAGIKIAKISGRGLGHTGGTLDKLESIPGLFTQLTEEHFVKQVQEVGIAISSQSPTLVPADHKLYALRDVTGTIPSIPLIAASIMSKKIAAGSDKILLDVTVGQGAFMQSLVEAKQLANWMVQIGDYFGKQTRAVLTDMNEPLGQSIGNSLEVLEAIDCLSGHGSADLRYLTDQFVLRMKQMAGDQRGDQDILDELNFLILNGNALDKFKQMIQFQGGKSEVIFTDSWGLPEGRTVVFSKQDGWLSELRSRQLGELVVRLGGGRLVKNATIDPHVGVRLHAKVGDFVEKGSPLLTVFHRPASVETQKSWIEVAHACYTFSNQSPSMHPLILGEISG